MVRAEYYQQAHPPREPHPTRWPVPGYWGCTRPSPVSMQMRALSASEARFRSVTESVNEAIVSTDRFGQILFWNRGAQAIFGCREEDVLGQPLPQVLFGCRQDDAGRYPGQWTGLQPSALVGKTVELLGLRNDRTEVPIELSVTEWTRDDEIFYTATIRDVTERRAVERMKNEFVSMVSHELRTPMSGIIGMADLLLRRNLPPQEREYAAAVRRSGEALQAIINDILDFSKIEAGRFEFEIETLDVRDVVEDAVTLLAKQAQSKGLELTCMIDPAIPGCLGGDPTRLRQVLLNLIGNAIKFTHTGDVVVHVDVSHEDPDSVLLRFEITDTGIGVSDESRARLFQAFSQADSSTTRQYGGAGLGLAISKRLAELMGGQVGAESAPGEGSTLWFTARLVQYAPGGVASCPPAELAGRRVLIVDDRETCRAALDQQLAAWDVASAGVADAHAALVHLRSAVRAGEPFSLVLVDRYLGREDGLALAHTIKTDPHLAGARLVLLTNLGEQVSPEDLRGAGIEVTVEKPVRQAQLFDVVARLLGTAESGTSGNSRMTVAALSSAASPRALPVATKAPPSLPAAEAPRVLLVEDTPMNQQVARGLLSELGCHVEVAASGKQALEVLADSAHRARFALVLMDCQMPELDGYRTTAGIRRLEAGSGRRIPVVAMTANAMQGDRERCLAAGMNDYLAKPVSYDQLAEVLRRWLPMAKPGAGGPPVTDSPPVTAIDHARLKRLEHFLGPTQSSELAGELLEIFRNEAPGRLATLRDAARMHDPSALQEAAHALRGNAALLGASELVELSSELEQLGRRGSTQGADALLPALETAIGRVYAALETSAIGPVD